MRLPMVVVILTLCTFFVHSAQAASPVRSVLRAIGLTSDGSITLTLEGKTYEAYSGTCHGMPAFVILDEQGRQHAVVRKNGRWMEYRTFLERMLGKTKTTGKYIGIGIGIGAGISCVSLCVLVMQTLIVERKKVWKHGFGIGWEIRKDKNREVARKALKKGQNKLLGFEFQGTDSIMR